MARRKKEDPSVHQNRIADQAEMLFGRKGIESTSMDDIAKAAGYSKATLYAYFKNKNDIVSFLELRSMSGLKTVISEVLQKEGNSRETFLGICFALTDFQQDSPCFFERSLEYISIDFDEKQDAYLGQTYLVGEEINAMIARFIECGVRKNEIRDCSNYFVLTFQIWGMISGLIKLANQKEEYIKREAGLTKQEFLREGFEQIFNGILEEDSNAEDD